MVLKCLLQNTGLSLLPNFTFRWWEWLENPASTVDGLFYGWSSSSSSSIQTLYGVSHIPSIECPGRWCLNSPRWAGGILGHKTWQPQHQTAEKQGWPSGLRAKQQACSTFSSPLCCHFCLDADCVDRVASRFHSHTPSCLKRKGFFWAADEKCHNVLIKWTVGAFADESDWFERNCESIAKRNSFNNDKLLKKIHIWRS